MYNYVHVIQPHVLSDIFIVTLNSLLYKGLAIPSINWGKYSKTCYVLSLKPTVVSQYGDLAEP